jgi:hypothetical protein
MAVIHLQTLVQLVAKTNVRAGRDGKTAAFWQPRAFLSLPLPMRRMRYRSMRSRSMRHPGDRERLDHEAALAARTGRSAGCTGGLTPCRATNARGASQTGWSLPMVKRSSSFDRRSEPKPCAWGRRCAA